MRNYIKKIQFFRDLYSVIKASRSFFSFKPILFIKKIVWFFSQEKKFNSTNNFNILKRDLYLCLFDNSDTTPLDPTYFYQDTWAAKHIFKLSPQHHIDIGSSATTIGIISQFVPVTMVDIRPLELNLEGLSFLKGDILNLPFKDNTVESLSSLCVVEHIGLGRYGDKIDSFGSEKAILEIKRVLKVGGVLLFSVPVDTVNKVYFNAHRSFTRDYILSLFDKFQLIDEKYQYGNLLEDNYDKQKGFGTGFYFLKKLI